MGITRYFFLLIVVGIGKMNVGLKEGVTALKELVANGVEESARGFNSEQKYKHIKVCRRFRNET